MIITRTSIFTGVERSRDLNITEEQYALYESGKLIQHAFPHLSADDREFILTGTTVEEWNDAFGAEDA